MAWSPRTAIRWIRRMEKPDLQWVEQPVPSWDIEGLAEVAQAVDTPLSADESCMTVRDAWRAREIVAIANAAELRV